MADSPDLGRRLRDAKRDYEKRHDVDLSWREIGEMVGAAMGRAPVKYQVVQRWFVDGREPAAFVETIAAIARALEVAPGWLAFGDSAHEKGRPDVETPDVEVRALPPGHRTRRVGPAKIDRTG